MDRIQPSHNELISPNEGFLDFSPESGDTLTWDVIYPSIIVNSNFNEHDNCIENSGIFHKSYPIVVFTQTILICNTIYFSDLISQCVYHRGLVLLWDNIRLRLG